MKTRLLLSLVTAASIGATSLIVACSSDDSNGPGPTPDSGTDTGVDANRPDSGGGDSGGGASFDEVYGIFEAKCNSCHSNVGSDGGAQMPRGGLSLVPKAAAHANLVNKAASTASACADAGTGAQPHILVVPGDPAKSLLLNKVDKEPIRCGTKMPRPVTPTSPLSDDQVDTIKSWIEDGAQQ